jgi:hypothetical protein
MNFVMKSTTVASGAVIAGLALFLAFREGGLLESRSTGGLSPDLRSHSATARVGESFRPVPHSSGRSVTVSAEAPDEPPFAGRTSGRLSKDHPSDSGEASAARDDGSPAQADERLAGADGDPAPRPAVPEPVRRAAELRKQLLEDAERVDEASGNAVFLRPAVWVDLGDDGHFPAGHSPMILAEAEALQKKISESGLDPSTPGYRRFWNQAVRESDWRFRARYGARVWSKHHIQAHHLSKSQKD